MTRGEPPGSSINAKAFAPRFQLFAATVWFSWCDGRHWRLCQLHEVPQG